MRTAIVTGAGRGIGAAVAEELAARGDRVVLAARTLPELVGTASRISATGGVALPVRCDVTREDEVDKLFREARDRFGPVEVLVNNAGAVDPSPVASMSLEAWRATLDANLTSAFLCSRAALADMVAAKRGCIVNVSSVAGVSHIDKYPGFAAYASSKAAVIALTETLAAEVEEQGIRVLCVSPGSVETKMFAKVAPGVKAAMVPTEIARIVAFLASDDARAASGSNLVVRG
jgi:NAD(P)-dependent dehydrogenase (short-subunit alcohol dehydrogenase family)